MKWLLLALIVAALAWWLYARGLVGSTPRRSYDAGGAAGGGFLDSIQATINKVKAIIASVSGPATLATAPPPEGPVYG